VAGASRIVIALSVLGLALWSGCTAPAAPRQFRRLAVEEYRQKMMAGWLGQMVGVAFGAPTEFRYMAQIMPEEQVPALVPGLANSAFSQDDLYVEMTFLHTLETYGLDVSSAQAGVDFANSEYELWHANKAGRDNLRIGIAPPDSGHPQFNGHSDDIDYQIESDFAGLISPGMPQNAIRLGETFGRLMNYGDGVYGGQFVSCMVAEAFFEQDPQRLVEAGLRCIPPQSQYAEAIGDVLRWWQENPDDWQATWRRINAKYQADPNYRRYSCRDEAIASSDFDIDAKINGAFVVLGLLYGGRNLEKTMTIAMRSGQDSDCNPSSAAGVLFATVGYDQLPGLFTDGLAMDEKFSYTDYGFERLLAVCEALARQSVAVAGGRIEVDAAGREVFVIPVQTPRPSEFVQSWQPGPIANSVFSAEQMEQITAGGGRLTLDLREFAPGWTAAGCSADPSLGLKAEIMGRPNVLLTSPPDHSTPCRIASSVTLPAGQPKALHLVVGHYPGVDWVLIVKANGGVLLNQVVGGRSAPDGWLEVSVDLGAYAGRQVQLELLNQPNGVAGFEGAYWAEIEVVDRP
jgi:hypothetical protein